MKKNLLTSLGALILSVCFLPLLAGCGKKETGGIDTSTSAGQAVEKTSFDAVAAKLDRGGNLYIYLSTEQLLAGLSGKVAEWRQLVLSFPEAQDEAENIGKVFDIVTRLIRDSGIEDASGFGVSGIAVEPGLYRKKAFLHHYPGKGKGFLWNMGGSEPHELSALNPLPASTAFATFSDFDLRLLWSVIQKHVNESGFDEVRELLSRVPAEFQQQTGVSWDKVLGSLGGEFGLVITLDESRKIAVPSPMGEEIQVPEPGILVFIKVRDETIFARVDQALKDVGMSPETVNNEKVKMRTMAVPLPLPVQLRPTLAMFEDYLIIATSDALVNEVLAVKGGEKPGLKTTEEFKRLSKGALEQGNQFTYLSGRLGTAIAEVQRQFLEAAAEEGGAPSDVLRALVPSHAAMSYSVSANTEEGWLTVSTGNQHPVTMLATAAVVPAAILAGVGLPAVSKAKQRAQNVTCLNNLRMIDAAKQLWALENNKMGSATPTAAELMEFLPAGMPYCPQGGRYTIGTVESTPTCTIPGHQLP